jgi:hypothetical protein
MEGSESVSGVTSRRSISRISAEEKTSRATDAAYAELRPPKPRPKPIASTRAPERAASRNAPRKLR